MGGTALISGMVLAVLMLALVLAKGLPVVSALYEPLECPTPGDFSGLPTDDKASIAGDTLAVTPAYPVGQNLTIDGVSYREGSLCSTTAGGTEAAGLWLSNNPASILAYHGGAPLIVLGAIFTAFIAALFLKAASGRV